ncbi:MAG TPA: pilin [Patescibacteria group bacterium]|nr:pilin [Patescibacteria group bacterium]
MSRIPFFISLFLLTVSVLFSGPVFAAGTTDACRCSGVISTNSVTPSVFDSICQSSLASKGCLCGGGTATCFPAPFVVTKTDCDKIGSDPQAFAAKLGVPTQLSVSVPDLSCSFGGGGGAPGRYGLFDPLSGVTIPQLIGGVIRFLIGLMGVALLGALVYGGVLYMTSGGDSKKVGTAQKTLVYALAGLVVVMGSYVIINFLLQISGKVGGAS